MNEDKIVIVGFSGRYGGASNTNIFFEKLVSGENFFTNKEECNPNIVNTYSSVDEIEYFDHEFFSMSPREAKYTDPQHRLFLEICYEVLENSGYSNRQIKKNIGVFASSSFNSYLINNLLNAKIDKNSIDYGLLIGNDKDFLATRVAYKLNLIGPATNIQNACSSSLAALNYACSSIANEECESALVGGVSLSFPHNEGYISRSEDNFSSDGTCRPFDEEANGLVKGNGCSVILIKKLSQALADKDTIYGVIDYIGINNDGSDKMSFTSPSAKAQEKVIKGEGLSQKLPDYIESHGTGTKLGDPIEIKALAKVYNSQISPIPIGSVKANVGHLDVAAGITSLIKAMYIMKNNVIPANINLKKINHNLNKYASLFSFPKENILTKVNDIALSSFGIGGTNVHVRLKRYTSQLQLDLNEELPLYFIPLSYNYENDLVKIKEELNGLLKNEQSFGDIVYSLSRKSNDYKNNLFMIVKNKRELLSFINNTDSISELTNGYDFHFNRQEINYIMDVFYGGGSSEVDVLLNWTSFLNEVIPELSNSDVYNITDEVSNSDNIKTLEKFYNTLSYFISKLGKEINFTFLYRNFNWRQIPTYRYPMNKKYFFEEVSVDGINKTEAECHVEYDLESMLLQIVSEVLEVSDIELDDDFYELGGDSLLAIDVLDKIQNSGISCTLQDFLDNPVLKDFLVFLEGNKSTENTILEPVISTKEVKDVLLKNKYRAQGTIEENQLDNVLLFGATGFLGSHLLLELAKLNHCKRIHCVVRFSENQTAEERMNQVLNFYFSSDEIKRIMQKVTIISGDVLKENFGMSREAYLSLKETTDFIINSAGSVEHYSRYDSIYQINVVAVEKIIAFAKESSAKYLHISTLAISGNNGLENSSTDGNTKIEFKECDLYVGQPLNNVYVKSKFEAEKIILQEISEGLNAFIFRVGNVTNRSSDGVFQRNQSSDAFTQRLLLMINSGEIPTSLETYPFEFSPVNEVAAAIVNLSQHNMDYNIFHINNNHYLRSKDLIKILLELNINVKIVEDNEFLETVDKLVANQNDAYLKEIRVNDLSKGLSIYKSDFKYNSDFTVKVLQEIGFEWSVIDREYLKQYFNYFSSYSKDQYQQSITK